jgi:hypothetical protein
MWSTREAVQIPGAALRTLLGEGSILPQTFRRNQIERFWSCGCVASYVLHETPDVTWVPCGTHAGEASWSEAWIERRPSLR